MDKKELPVVRGFGERLLQWLFGLTEGWEKRRDIVQNNFELGLRHLKTGHHGDAIMRFKIVTMLEPGYAEAWFYLGSAQLASGDRAAAQKALRKAAKLKPGYAEAAYLAAVAGGSAAPAGELPQTMPVSLARDHFDAIAADYDHEQLEVYGYRGHLLLAEAVRGRMVPGRIDHVILELGVLTGLCGPLLRDVAAQLTGVDISGRMLAEAMRRQDAQGRKAYDALIHREAQAFLREAAPSDYDVVLSCGMLSFIGEAGELFAQVARVLKKGGLFAFTADRMDGDGFRLDAQGGRFRFSQAYLRGLASANGLRELQFEEAPVYPDDKAWLCVFAKL